MNENRPKIAYVIRQGKNDDLCEVNEIEKLSFKNPWNHYSFKTAIKDTFLVYSEDNEVIGFLIAVCCYKGIRANILRVATHPDHRKKGVATKLLDSVMDNLIERGILEVVLDVDMVRSGAVRLYEKFGFKIDKAFTMDEDEESFYTMKLEIQDLKRPDS